MKYFWEKFFVLLFLLVNIFTIDVNASRPTVTNLLIKNSDGLVVTAESGSRNHLCQLDFETSSSSRRVIFEADVDDVDGWTDINGAVLEWNGNNYLMTLIGGLGTGATLRAVVDFGSGDNDSLTHSLLVDVVDNEGENSGFVDSGRNWKVWNCQVSVLGKIYDGSIGQACNNIGFTVEADSNMEFSNLIYKNNDGEDIDMSTNLPADYGPTNVVFSDSYLPIFNYGSVVNPDGSLKGTNRITRIIDLGTGTTHCPVATQFDIDSNVSAYSVVPSAKIDFSFIRSQEGWFQVSGAGVKAKNVVGSGVPLTADPVTRALSITGILADNGLVSFATYSNINGNNNDTDYGLSNNWWINRSTNSSNTYSYQNFYNNFFVNRSIGETGINWDSKPSEGLYFVNGNLNIDSDFTLDSGKFLMVVVRGNITIAETVNRLDGIYIADGGITASGFSDTQLVINGMLYSRNNIRLSRSYVTKILNNTLPATKVNYRPDLIFNMPGILLREVSGWREE